ncbi:unnamed protein product [Medioppia subpectinata]|uniref:NYN domain-containing protein n=1 Tax=Medioppia subpectinata TaxID=1979941 RepID=A0A7R9PU62_9ACAR|nr:unnamed protein product [Medioppia subpectinata]CAG2101192.1 unnamed protein product [Medioppia subpectinata]
MKSIVLTETVLITDTMDPSLTCQSYGIFWDIENCAIPSMERAATVVQRVKQFIATKFESTVGQRPEPCVFICSCDTRTLDARHVEALNRYGVDILHVNAVRVPYKVDADCKLMECMQKFTDHHRNTNPMFLITGDIDFAPAIRAAKRRGFQVILLFGGNASEDLKHTASESHSYNSIIGTEDMESRSNNARTPSGAHSSAAVNPQLIPLQIPQQNLQLIPQQTLEPNPEIDENKVKMIEEVTGLDRHIAIEALNTYRGNITLAITALIDN